MSMSIDDIWDEPAMAVSPRPVQNDSLEPSQRPSPAKRRRTKLFLSDSEDESQENPPSIIPSKTPKKRPDIEALFDDIDDDAFQELAPALDVEAIRKKAAAKLPPLTPHAILPSSSPPRDFGNSRAGGGTNEGGKDAKGKDGKSGLHERKQRATLNAERLVDEAIGFPALMKEAKHFRPRGKGHELADLNRLMQVYQFWSHKLYPKQTFHANVQQIEKVCHTRRMLSSLGSWKDQFHGTVNGAKPQDPLLDDSESGSEGEEEQRAATSTGPRNILPSSSPPRTAFTGANVDEDDFDIDAVIREEEERVRQGAANNAAQTAQSPGNPAPSAPATLDEEDEAMWDQFGFDDDALLAATQEPTNQSKTNSAVPASMPTEDEDEDMWDAVREYEQEQEYAKHAKPSQAGGESGGGGDDSVVGSDGKGGPIRAPQSVGNSTSNIEKHSSTNDEGWDEMYL